MEYTPKKQRTIRQNSACHLWFDGIAKECLDKGVTVNDIIGQTMNLQVDGDFIKYLFRRIGKKKYGKESTSFLAKDEIDPIIDEMIKFFAEKVEPPIELPPFPHIKEGEADKDGKIKIGNY